MQCYGNLRNTREGYVITKVIRTFVITYPFLVITYPFLVLVHIHCRIFVIFNSHDLLASDLVAESVEQR